MPSTYDRLMLYVPDPLSTVEKYMRELATIEAKLKEEKPARFFSRAWINTKGKVQQKNEEEERQQKKKEVEGPARQSKDFVHEDP